MPYQFLNNVACVTQSKPGAYCASALKACGHSSLSRENSSLILTIVGFFIIMKISTKVAQDSLSLPRYQLLQPLTPIMEICIKPNQTPDGNRQLLVWEYLVYVITYALLHRISILTSDLKILVSKIIVLTRRRATSS